MKLNDELKKIAMDLYSNKIFCDRHLRDPEKEMSMVFMPIIFMEKKQLEELEKQKPAFIYEYLNKALPGSINGYPMFMSMQTLNQEQFDIMWKYHEKIKASVDEVLEDTL